jgi:hypothetical protein
VGDHHVLTDRNRLGRLVEGVVGNTEQDHVRRDKRGAVTVVTENDVVTDGAKSQSEGATGPAMSNNGDVHRAPFCSGPERVPFVVCRSAKCTHRHDVAAGRGRTAGRD